MARPPAADAEATRARLLDCAVALFADKGVDAVSIRELARAAGVSSAMVHHCFGNKQGLHQAAIDAMYARLLRLSSELLRVATSQPRDPFALIANAVRAGFGFARDNQSAVRLLMRDVMASGELVVERREGVQRPFLDRIADLIASHFDGNRQSSRLRVQSAVSLIVRYGVSSEAELCLFAGEEDPERARVLVEDHLVELICSLFGPNEKKRG